MSANNALAFSIPFVNPDLRAPVTFGKHRSMRVLRPDVHVLALGSGGDQTAFKTVHHGRHVTPSTVRTLQNERARSLISYSHRPNTRASRTTPRSLPARVF